MPLRPVTRISENPASASSDESCRLARRISFSVFPVAEYSGEAGCRYSQMLGLWALGSYEKNRPPFLRTRYASRRLLTRSSLPGTWCRTPDMTAQSYDDDGREQFAISPTTN